MTINTPTLPSVAWSEIEVTTGVCFSSPFQFLGDVYELHMAFWFRLWAIGLRVCGCRLRGFGFRLLAFGFSFRVSRVGAFDLL